jgi:hypothetical protein
MPLYHSLLPFFQDCSKLATVTSAKTFGGSRSNRSTEERPLIVSAPALDVHIDGLQHPSEGKEAGQDSAMSSGLDELDDTILRL